MQIPPGEWGGQHLIYCFVIGSDTLSVAAACAARAQPQMTAIRMKCFQIAIAAANGMEGELINVQPTPLLMNCNIKSTFRAS